MSTEEDRTFFRNYAIIIALLAVMIVVFLVIARVVGVESDVSATAKMAVVVAENTAPVGDVRLEGDIEQQTPPIQQAAITMLREPQNAASLGERIYSGLCVTCHSGNIPNIPRVGDRAEWAPRIAQGKPLLYERAIVGFIGTQGVMPARGGNPALTDEEVKAAVDYMIEESR